MIAATDRGADEVCLCHLFCGLGGDWRVELLELLILSDEFRDEWTSLYRHRIFAMLDGEVQECDEFVGLLDGEFERQFLHGWMLVCRSGEIGSGGFRGRNPRERRRDDWRIDLPSDLRGDVRFDGSLIDAIREAPV